MYTPDLEPSCQFASGPAVRAIGWLEKGQHFPVGPVDPHALAALRSHVTDPGRWLPLVSCGVHFCDLGRCEGGAGAQNVIIPSTDRVYVAPELVLHYVEAHGYSPPAEFLEAVVACPEQSSESYVERLIPFADTWGGDAEQVRRIAADAVAQRKLHAEVRNRLEANCGRFRW